MASQLYLDKHLADRVVHLPLEERAQVIQKLDLLSEDAVGNSDPVTNASDLRITEAGNHRIILTYVPDQQTVIVTGVDAMPYAASEENKAAA